jgi:hypothetical protein
MRGRMAASKATMAMATALGALPMLSWGALGGQRGGRWHDGAVTMMNRAMVLHA